MTLPTLFCHIVLRTYVPEGLGGLVDALADPKGYLSMIDKRQQQLELMGIKTEDIGEVPQKKLKQQNSKGSQSSTSTVVTSQRSQPGQSSLDYANSTSAGGAKANAQDSLASTQTSSGGKQVQPDETPFKSTPIKIEDLRREKSFQKLLKKHQKELEEMKKRHQKERNAVQKAQCSSIDRLLAETSGKTKVKRRGSSGLFRLVPNSSAPDLKSDQNQKTPSDTSEDLGNAENEKVRFMVVQQTTEWSELVKRQLQEEHRLRRAHITEEWDLLRKLLNDALKGQMGELKSLLETYSKDLRASQTKKSMEDAKTIQGDKSIKTKAEKERRVKEINEKNLKVFYEERKRLAVKHERQTNTLSKEHTEYRETFEKEARKALEMEEQLHAEALLAVKPETVV